METIGISPDALKVDSVISFTIDLISAAHTLTAWAAPLVISLEQSIRDYVDSHLGAAPMDRGAFADRCAIQMPFLKDYPGLSPFDNRVGQLMVLAHLRWGPRIPEREYQQIASVIDQQGWKPLRQLEGDTRKQLATWNQQSGRPIHSFEQALARKSKFRRAALRRFYRAHDKYRKMNLQLSA
jgi:hypothetical protein